MTSGIIQTFCSGVLLAISAPCLAQSPWLTHYGDSGCGSNFVPVLYTSGGMPAIGNGNFRIVSENLTGGTPGFFLLSNAPADFPFHGMAVYVNPFLLLGIGCQAKGTPGIAGAGTVSVPLQIPNSSVLVGNRYYLQGFFSDSFLPSKLVHTHGLGVTIALIASTSTTVIWDRKDYQALFAGVTSATQAETLGRSIWAANQVAGYSYVKIEMFTCGGESHWTIIVKHLQTGMEFCLVPGGSFRMGDISSTGWPEEKPVHWVRIRPFFIARTEVPQSVWQSVMGSNPSYWKGPTLPVEMVNWNDAKAFCMKTNLRLPSEAEWEYACRAGVDTCYNSGVNYPSTNLIHYSWYDANSGLYTHPVAGKLPNSFGLYDMHGNVWEWCEDSWPDPIQTGSYNCAPSDGKALVGSSLNRAIRGGCWISSQIECRSSTRNRGGISTNRNGLGFRPSGPSLQ